MKKLLSMLVGASMVCSGTSAFAVKDGQGLEKKETTSSSSSSTTTSSTSKKEAAFIIVNIVEGDPSRGTQPHCIGWFTPGEKVELSEGQPYLRGLDFSKLVGWEAASPKDIVITGNSFIMPDTYAYIVPIFN